MASRYAAPQVGVIEAYSLYQTKGEILKKIGVALVTAALALTPAVAGAKTKHVPCGKTKAHHTNCGKHLAKGHNKKK